MQCSLTVSDIIEIVGIVASLITSIAAISISVRTLKQNSQMIEESTRPYVAVYREYIQILNTPHEYLVVKNFGSTGATIDSLTITPPFGKSDICNNPNFDNLAGSFIAPHQSISTTISANAFKNKRVGITKIFIKYHSTFKEYCETFTLNENLINDFRTSKPIPSPKKPLKNIVSGAAEEIIRHNL